MTPKIEKCAKCGARLDPGLTRCPDCKAQLAKAGAFIELLGWVVAVVSAIPIIVGIKTAAQNYYPPLIVGGAAFFLGVVLVVLGKGQARSSEETVTRESLETQP